MRLTRLRFLTCFALTCCVGALTAHAADREFRTIVDAISSEYHASPVHIPMFGLVNVVTFFVKPAGTRHIDLAVFDNLRDHDRAGGDLNIAIRHAVGPEWNPLLRTRSHHHGDEQLTSVYTRPDGSNWKLLLTTLDRDNATVIELTLDPKAMERWFADPVGSAHHVQGESKSDNKRWDP